MHSLLQKLRVIAALIWVATWAATSGLAENSAGKVERLGFKFDVQAHEAAVAAEKAGAGGDASGAELEADDVLHLEKVVVGGRRGPLVERELLTPQGKLLLARKTYLTPAYQKTFGLLEAAAALLANPRGGWNPNNPEAMVLYEDVQLKRRTTEMKQLYEIQGIDARAAAQASEDKPAKP